MWTSTSGCAFLKASTLSSEMCLSLAPKCANTGTLGLRLISSGVVDGGLDVLHHARGRQRLDGGLQRHACAHVLLGVAELHVLLHAVEGGRRDRQVAVL